MKKVNHPACGECCFFKGEDANGMGGCMLKDYEIMLCDDPCDLDHTDIRREDLQKGLREFQKWRRGGKGRMPQPYVIGKLIDAAIYRLRHDVIYD